MKLSIKKLLEPIELVFIGFGNLFYNLGMTIYETFLFGGRSWWWKIRFQYFINYIFSRTNWIVRRESPEFDYPEENFIYGETPCFTVKNILDAIECEPGDLFVDLGCGRGLTVFYAHFLKGLTTRGYELLPAFVRKARKIANSIDDEGVKFFENDVLDADLSGAKIVYIAGTTFPDDFIRKLNRKLREAPPGCHIVTLSYHLPDKYFNLYREMLLYFSWGKSHVYFHKRRDKKEQKKMI